MQGDGGDPVTVYYKQQSVDEATRSGKVAYTKFLFLAI